MHVTLDTVVVSDTRMCIYYIAIWMNLTEKHTIWSFYYRKRFYHIRFSFLISPYWSHMRQNICYVQVCLSGKLKIEQCVL